MIDLPPPPTHVQQIENIAACGIARDAISIVYQDVLQSDEITISDAGAPSEAKWLCLRGAVHPFYALTLSDPEQRTSYYEVDLREGHREARANARAWLAANHMLGRVPIYRSETGIDRFAREIEAACSVVPGSAIAIHGESLLTIRTEFLAAQLDYHVGGAMTCLSHMIAASNASEAGISFGFIGNEANR